MSASNPPGNPLGATVPPGATADAARSIRRALDRLETVAILAFVIGVLVLAESYLASTGAFAQFPRPGAPFDVTWTVGVQLGLAVAFALVIAVLVIFALINIILGAVAWRRGVLGMVKSAPEFGSRQVENARAARSDHRTTLWLFLALVLTAIVVSAVLAGFNGTLALLGAATLPSTLISAAVNLATGIVLVLIYYFGTRHIALLLTAVATPAENDLLARGRSRMILGAVVGLGAAFTALSWLFGVVGLVSLALIVPGIRDLGRAYDLWLSAHQSVPSPTHALGAAA